MQTRHLRIFNETDQRYQIRLQDENGKLITDPTLIDAHRLHQVLHEASAHYNPYAASRLGEIGQNLWRTIDPNGTLQQLLSTQQPLCLQITADQGLGHVPWELLHDGQGFLCGHPTRYFTPVRTVVDGRRADTGAANRPLRVLFMACSPLDMEPVLNFEQEEARILEATEMQKQPIELIVEESGSLQGLKEMLQSFPDQTFDVLHLSGHADIQDNSPFFYMETASGAPSNITAAELAQHLAAIGRLPRVVFLSGCRTAQAPSKEDATPSFSEALVQAGIPLVLGWALPVGDGDASSAAAHFYGQLATGNALDHALAVARQKLCQEASPYWHYLRAYGDSTPLTPLVTPKNTRGRARVQVREAKKAMLDAGAALEVCDRSRFVGRRRLLQRALKALQTDANDARYCEGVLLTGMGGIGKSSAAARLLDRLRHTHDAVIWHGGLDELQLIRCLADKNPAWAETLNGTGGLKQRLLQVLQSDQKQQLWLFDDFEQNVLALQTATPQYRPEARQVLEAVLHAIHDSETSTRVIVTCRYTVKLPSPLRWHEEALDSLRDADLRKKQQQLNVYTDAKVDDSVRQQITTLAAGNPRLLERLNRVVEDPHTDTAALTQALAGTQIQFREQVLLRTLMELQTRAVRRSLAYCALLQIPMPVAVLTAASGEVGVAPHLRRAAKLGLVEIIPTPQETLYYVSPLLHADLQAVLDENERGQGRRRVVKALSGQWQQAEEPMQSELLRLVLLMQDQEVAAEVADHLASRAVNRHRYREAEALCQQVLAFYPEHVGLLHTMARAQSVLGRDEVQNTFARALRLAEARQGTEAQQRERANLQYNYSNWLIRTGAPNQAMTLLAQEVLPVYDKLGDVRSKAVTMGKIADIYYARGALDEALRIRLEEELPVYDKLGDVRSILICKVNIAWIYLQQTDSGCRNEARQLLCGALREARRLKLAEISTIEGVLADSNLICE